MKSQPSKRARKDKKQGKEASNNPMPVKWNEMNRKQRREMMRKVQSEDLSLQVVHPHPAGIDIGNESHYVAVPPSRDPQPVRCFGCTTAELKTMAQWLTQCGIRTVANSLILSRKLAETLPRATMRNGAARLWFVKTILTELRSCLG